MSRQETARLYRGGIEPRLTSITKESTVNIPKVRKRGFLMVAEKDGAVIRKVSHYAFEPTTPSLVSVREFIRMVLYPFETIQPYIEDIISATHEACINSIVHNPDCGELIKVTCRISDDSVIIEVADKGRGLKNVELPPEPPSPDSLAGRGLFIMCALMDNVETESNSHGTLVRMRKHCMLET
ncbi:MAG: ATP-binding protein [Actinobacteria bacterium]|nr:ATP-binding protein [Actinomycetota bacterium]